MNYFRHNLKFLRKKAGLSQTDFAKKIGVNRPIIGSYEEGRAEPKFETLQNISHFFQITLDDLLEKKLSQNSKLLIKNTAENDIRVLPIIVNQADEELIPLVSIKAAAGYINSYEDISFVENLPKFSLPVPETSQGTFRAFQIKGDSMLPILPNSYIVAEFVEDWNWIKDGDSYIVVSKEEGIVYKRLEKDFEANKELILHSDNAAYEPFRLNLADVVEVWKAKGYLSFEMPEKFVPPSSVDELGAMMLKLKEEVALLKRKGQR